MEVAQTIRNSGGQALAITADVSIADAVQNLFQATVKEFGTVDVLVNNAGICPFVEWFDLTEGIWDQVHQINLKGAFLCLQAASTAMAAELLV